jgi:hypothetical protein
MKTDKPRPKLAWSIGLCVIVVAALGGTARWLALDYENDKARQTPASEVQFVELDWQTLVPKGWDPLKRYRSLPLGALDDKDPKVVALMQQMRETWDNAPTNGDLDGARVRMTGYLVPLDTLQGGLREFLLVPYFGACIHTPPPPANQIVHVTLAQPVMNLRSMQAVTVNGTLSTQRNDTAMGTSGYTLQASLVEKRKSSAW